MTDWFAGAAAEHQDDDTTHLPVEPVVDVLVVGVGVPSGDRLSVFDLGDTHVGVDEWGPSTQRFWSHMTSTCAKGFGRGARCRSAPSPPDSSTS